MSVKQNAIFNILEVIISAFSLFFIYRIINLSVGVGSLGIWSLVLSTTSLARLADIGLSGGLGKFVAQYDPQNADQLEDEKSFKSPPRALDYIEVTIIFNILIFSMLSIIAYFPSKIALSTVLFNADRVLAIKLLPYSLLSFLINNITSVILTSIIGLSKSYIKSIIIICSMVLFISMSFVLLPKCGLVGIALAQICQGMFSVLVGWVWLCRRLKARGELWVPNTINLNILKSLLNYGVKNQFLTLASFFYDPIVKYLFALSGGVIAVGIYEMASRLVGQVRQLVAVPSENLLPLYVRSIPIRKNYLKIYQISSALIIPAGLFLLLLLISVTPLISNFWIGHGEEPLALYVAILSIGWWLNISAIPAFYIGMASGRFGWNILGSFITTVSTIFLGFLAWKIGSPVGTVVAASSGIGLGALVIIYGNTRMFDIKIAFTLSTYRNLLNHIGGKK